MTNRRYAQLLTVFALTGCHPAINHSLNSVPEEGGVRFTQLTTASDQVFGPEIYPSRQFGLQYYVLKPFDISPDGKTLAFLGKKNDKINIFLKMTDGGMATTQRTFRDLIYDVSFSADGERLSFADLRNERWNVFEISAHQGTAIRQLTNFEQVSRYPVYVPGGKRLMFVQYERSAVGTTTSLGRPGGEVYVTRYYIWETDLERNAFTQYSEGYAPSFSPDGKRMAITRNSRDHGNAEIWLIELATGLETLIASSKAQGYAQPSFSPDGQRLVFTGVTLRERSRPANFDIFVVDVNGSNITQMTFHPGHDLAARFAPDGRSIYFLSQRGSAKGEWNIWRMDFNR